MYAKVGKKIRDYMVKIKESLVANVKKKIKIKLVQMKIWSTCHNELSIKHNGGFLISYANKFF